MKQAMTEAKEQDLVSSEWIAQLAVESRQLHRTIKLPEAEGDQALFNFVLQYIEAVPGFIEHALNTAAKLDLLKSIEPIVKQAMVFFRHPPKQVRTKHHFNHLGNLYKLMDQAYLAHRLLEELNDAFMLQTGMPILPMDTTKANLIIYGMIGDNHGCELEDIVQESASQFDLYQLAANTTIDTQQVSLLEQNWPCFSTQLGICLQLRERHLRLVSP
ncbi:hypothetical protein [Spartinivicinus ruber]|uniref:hypothetical protein n=1 Tax=Spartinivicinus ruber TaxID=2683272 RepID=UPI0013D65ED7|nr:hypothetical protein [Spartinivicinus ruber]